MKYQLRENSFEGKLIIFTGVDGAGKTTLLEFCKEYLEKRGISLYITKMPSDRIRGLDVFRNFHDSNDEQIRKSVDVFSLTVLASGDRLIVQDTEIIPNLNNGKWVLCDRYCFTGNVRCDDHIIDQLTERFLAPDLMILADASPQVLKKRVMEREDEKNLYYDDKGVMEQRKRYLEIAHENGLHIIDTEQNWKSIEKQLSELLDHEIQEWNYKKWCSVIEETAQIEITQETLRCSFSDLEIDSFKFISCIAAIEDAFDIAFSDEELDYSKFVFLSDLFKASMELIKAKSL